MPRQQNKPKFRRGFKKWSDEKAKEFREIIGIKHTEPLCAFELCNHLKIPVFTPKQISGLDNKIVDHLLGKGKNYWSAATVPLSLNKYFIIHNPTHTPARQQSNLMHELAHIICEHKIPDSERILGLSGFLRHHNQEQEDEAEWLGACLQLPRPALVWALRRGMSEMDISDYYNASIEMVKYRINITGVRKQISFSRKYYSR